jgi:hypothetical protein
LTRDRAGERQAHRKHDRSAQQDHDVATRFGCSRAR